MTKQQQFSKKIIVVTCCVLTCAMKAGGDGVEEGVLRGEKTLARRHYSGITCATTASCSCCGGGLGVGGRLFHGVHCRLVVRSLCAV